MTTDTMKISNCKINNTLIKFNPPFEFELRYYKQRISATDDKVLMINATSTSMEKLRVELEEKIGLLWNVYVNCPVTQLTKDAIEFRNELKKRVIQ